MFEFNYLQAKSLSEAAAFDVIITAGLVLVAPVSAHWQSPLPTPGPRSERGAPQLPRCSAAPLLHGWR